MNRQELADAILAVLHSSTQPLEAKEIVRRLGDRSVTKSDVNSALYGELSRAGKVAKGAEHQWTAVGSVRASSTRPTSAERPGTAAAGPVAAGPTLGVGAGTIVAPRPTQAASEAGKTNVVFTPDDLASVSAAVREEIAAAQQQVKSSWLDIDGIEHLSDQPGAFVYRLALSTPAHFSPDQALTFQTRNPRDSIPAVVVRSDDEGLIVECQKPLPTDAKLLSFSLDPTFILRALEKFIQEMAPCGGRIAHLLLSKTIPAPKAVQPRTYPGLNEDQALAVEEMNTTPLHLLWGPPGTGKLPCLAWPWPAGCVRGRGTGRLDLERRRGRGDEGGPEEHPARREAAAPAAGHVIGPAGAGDHRGRQAGRPELGPGPGCPQGAGSAQANPGTAANPDPLARPPSRPLCRGSAPGGADLGVQQEGGIGGATMGRRCPGDGLHPG